MLKILYSLLVVGLFLPVAGVAQAAIVSCGTGCTINDLIAIPVNIFNFLLGLSAFVFLAVIVFAGARIVMYSVSESPESELASAKNTLRQGITGFLIIGLSWLIVNTLINWFVISPGTGVGNALQNIGF